MAAEAVACVCVRRGAGARVCVVYVCRREAMGEGGCSGVVLGVDANHSGIRAWEDLHSE